MNRAARSQQFTESCWYGQSWVSVVLAPLAWLFGLLTAVRRRCYAAGFFRVHKAGLPVIVVGNITAGGTGKTPVVAWLADELQQRGLHPGIISRGYGGTAGAQPRHVKADSDPAECGDEPLLLARLTGLPVVVCRDRLAAARQAGQLGANVIIADDGLQHYRMHRDAEIAVIDGDRMFGNGRRVPAGPLREAVSRLASVDAVLINGGGSDLGRRFDLRVASAVALDGSMERPLRDFSGQEVWAVAGIGNPRRFFAALRELGIRLREVVLADHGRTSLAKLLTAAQLPVLMTQKDAVKYSPVAGSDIWYVPATLEITDADAAAVVGAIMTKLTV